MSENVDNIVLEQLRLIRQDLAEVKSDIDDLKVGQQALQGMVISLSGYIRDIDQRVEHLEDKIEG